MSETPTCDRWRFETDTGAEVVPVDIAEALEIELERARAEVWRLKTVSLSGMINATKLSSAELKAAQRLRKESSPEALESERAANALLTEELERKDNLIEQMRDALRLARGGLVCADYSGVEDGIERIEAALEAAERGNNNE